MVAYPYSAILKIWASNQEGGHSQNPSPFYCGALTKCAPRNNVTKATHSTNRQYVLYLFHPIPSDILTQEGKNSPTRSTCFKKGPWSNCYCWWTNSYNHFIYIYYAYINLHVTIPSKSMLFCRDLSSNSFHQAPPSHWKSSSRARAPEVQNTPWLQLVAATLPESLT